MEEIISCGRAFDVCGREDRQRAVRKCKGKNTIATDRAHLGDRCATVVAKWSRSPKGTYHYSALENFFQKNKLTREA